MVDIRCPSCSYSYDYDVPESQPARGEYIGRQVAILEEEHPYHPKDD